MPARRLETLERKRVRVGQGSTIQVQKNTYSVPARLRGEWVEARIGAEWIEVWYAGTRVQTMERLRGQSKHRIDYRHVIWSLVRKPGAFRRYVFREALFPNLDFRRAYDALLSTGADQADMEYLRILHLAASDGEECVRTVLAALLGAALVPTYESVRAQVRGERTPEGAPLLDITAPDLAIYDRLLNTDTAEVCV